MSSHYLNNNGLLIIESLGTRFSEIWSKIQKFQCKKINLKISSAKLWPFCLHLNVSPGHSGLPCCNQAIACSNLLPARRQAITWNQCWLIVNWAPGNKFSEIWIGFPSFSFRKIHFKLLSAKMAAILSTGEMSYTAILSCCKQLTTKLRLLNFVYLIANISSPPEQNDRHPTDGIFKYIFMNEKFCILINISLKFVPKGQVNNIPPSYYLNQCWNIVNLTYIVNLTRFR